MGRILIRGGSGTVKKSYGSGTLRLDEIISNCLVKKYFPIARVGPDFLTGKIQKTFGSAKLV
jgi:hypothetical protein